MKAEEMRVGCFQVVLVFLLGINYVIVAMSHALPVFHNYTPNFYCQTNDTKKLYGCQSSNATLENDFNVTFESTTECSGEYYFAKESGESSVVTEWNLVCERRFWTLLGPSVYYFGVLIGAWLAGFLTDRIGRLPVKAICLYTQGTMAVALYVVQNYPMFLILRGLQGIFVQGLQSSTYILSLELFPARSRSLVALIMQISWALGLALLALLNYMVPDWRILQLAVSVPTAVTVLYIWIIPESPRWLLARGKSTEADMALEKIARYNGCCGRNKKKVDDKSEMNVKEPPMKPERKSRVSSVELRKAKADEETREEATSLLTKSELAQQKNRKASLQAISEHAEKKCSNTTESDAKNETEVERRDMPSSSKSTRRARSISQPVCNQRISLRNAEEIVEFEGLKKKDNVGNGKEEGAKKKEKKERRDMRNFFSESLARKYTTVVTCQWFTLFMACHLTESLTPDFNINRHVTFALGGALELASYVFTYFVISRFGRRVPLCMYQVSNGAICITVAVLIILPNSLPVWTDLAKTVILLFGRVTIVSTISVIYLYTVEIFPTVIRGTCLGMCAVFSRIGSLTMPLIVALGGHVPITIALTVAGTFCLLSGILALILPETINEPLPDNVGDVKQLSAKRENGNCESPNNEKSNTKEDQTQREILRDKLFSEDWVDAGNGILVNFSENKTD